MSTRKVKKTVSISTTIFALILAAVFYFGYHESPPSPVSLTPGYDSADTVAASSQTSASGEAQGSGQSSSEASLNAGHSYVESVIKMPAAGMEGLKQRGYIKAKVVKIVDGDTLDVNYNGREYKVRMLCIDTPESVKRGVAVQPYGKEASGFTKEKVYGKDVTLVFDKVLRDRYGRLLAFVIMDGGVDLNAMLVGEGFARIEIVKPNNTYEEYFLQLQQGAIDRKTGLWGLPSDQQPFIKNKDGDYIPRYYDQEKAS